METDWEWWESDLYFFADEIARLHGILVDVKKCYFSFYPTSATWHFDGFCDFEKCLNSLELSEEEKKYLRWNDSIEFNAEQRYRNICHYSSVDYRTFDNEEEPEIWISEEEQEKIMRKVEMKWDNLCNAIAHELEKILETQYEFLISEENIEEVAEMNEMIFDVESGEIFHLSDIEKA